MRLESKFGSCLRELPNKGQERRCRFRQTGKGQKMHRDKGGKQPCERKYLQQAVDKTFFVGILAVQAQGKF